MKLKTLRRARGVLSALAALAGGVSAGPARAEEEKILNVYNWSDYIAEDTIANFEKETGIKVRYDNFDNNEILHAKLVAGKTGYDIVVPSSYWAKLQADGGLLQKIDKSKLPNWKNLDPVLLEQLAKLDPGNQYQVNWMWGYTTIGINVDKVKAALGNMPMPENAWDLAFKPEYISRRSLSKTSRFSTHGYGSRGLSFMGNTGARFTSRSRDQTRLITATSRSASRRQRWHTYGRNSNGWMRLRCSISTTGWITGTRADCGSGCGGFPMTRKSRSARSRCGTCSGRSTRQGRRRQRSLPRR